MLIAKLVSVRKAPFSVSEYTLPMNVCFFWKFIYRPQPDKPKSTYSNPKSSAVTPTTSLHGRLMRMSDMHVLHKPLHAMVLRERRVSRVAEKEKNAKIKINKKY